MDRNSVKGGKDEWSDKNNNLLDCQLMIASSHGRCRHMRMLCDTQKSPLLQYELVLSMNGTMVSAAGS